MFEAKLQDVKPGIETEVASTQLETEIRGDDWAFLRSANSPPEGDRGSIRIVDLFCGAGGLSLGAWEAASSLSFSLDVRFAADFEPAALACYEKNFPSATTQRIDLREIFSATLSSALNKSETELKRKVGEVDLLMGGPPCQGHSDLNNFSRRDDPKNHLYRIMGRAAKVLKPKHVLIENVPGAAHDRSGSVATTLHDLKRLGYFVDVDVVDALSLGVAQSRKRLIVVASLTKQVRVLDVIEAYKIKRKRDLAWAVLDLEKEPASTIVNSPAASAKATRKRIDFLFDRELFDLPDTERPPCHRDAKHSYKSVYGRLAWGQPSQTITSGFYSMCMGRYVHPSQRRTLTAHEAARIQFFPDYFNFEPAKNRTALAQIIGNAVPPKLVYPFVRELFKVQGDK